MNGLLLTPTAGTGWPDVAVAALLVLGFLVYTYLTNRR